MKYFMVDNLQVYAAESRAQMGQVAGQDVCALIKVLLEEKEELNVMFAAAPSQDDVLQTICADKGIDWSRVNAFHMDEYIGLPADAPQGFGNFLRERIFDRLSLKAVYYLNPVAVDGEAEALRYQRVLMEHPMDICVLGVGENGHLAFNDPGEADFEDARLVKTVCLDQRCRQQQVNDGCFQSLSQVPQQALSVTIPGLLRAKAMFCVVPTVRKAEAVRNLLTGVVGTQCPASVLRLKAGAKLYLDPEAASMLK